TMPLAGPTHVGMDRPGCYPGLVQKRRPHARGDGPSTTAPSPGTGSQAPRTWGWTVNEAPELNHMYAGPTHVGMDRQRGPRVEPHVRRPHARGDGPSAPGTRSGTCAQAPRTWGWTVNEDPELNHMYAGPTHVGMDRARLARRGERVRRPHARGDGPQRTPLGCATRQQAPRTWGWTVSVIREAAHMSAGPTHVGMDRRRFRPMSVWMCRPRARGDGPICSP